MSKHEQAYGGKIKNPLDDVFGKLGSPAKESSVSLDQITLPQSQPRRYFDPQAQMQLVESVRQHGILQPLLVRPLPNGSYELVAGERRYRAAAEVGLETVPIIERELSDTEAFQLALIENLQREDLNPVEETEGVLHLLALQLNLKAQEIPSLLYRLKHEAERKSDSGHNVMPNPQLEKVETLFCQLGRMTWESFVKNRLPLLNLPKDVLEAVETGEVAYTKARAIAQIKLEDSRKAVLKQAISEDWSLQQIKEHVKTVQPKSEQSTLGRRLDATCRKFKKAKVWEYPELQQRVEELLVELEALATKLEQ
ncbi:chromosome partitioning protein, ParB family (plasmid) [Leptolyngbya sp. NIES-3755]|nr:chromosome partitioning protein, ParB family [Leptolyngbya sp. NIES-3755]